MGNRERGGYEPPESGDSQLATEIIGRADSVSKKVKIRVIERFIPKINDLGGSAEMWLKDLEDEFYILAENPNDPCGEGNYDRWLPREIKELYFVLFGKEIESPPEEKRDALFRKRKKAYFEKKRKKNAESLGLSPDATWDEIEKTDDESHRKNRATSLGLSPDATWDEINEEARKQGIELRRHK